VLLVQDELLVRLHGVDLLEEHGFEVMEAANADVALAVLQADPQAVEAVITDVNMPGAMDGCALAREVHQRWPWIKIVITSGHARLSPDEVPDHGRFVPKPWPSGALVNAIVAAGQA
jgi:CheY-like chemotaxis protein